MLQFAETALRIVARTSTVLAMAGLAFLVVLMAASIVTRFFVFRFPPWTT